MYKKTNYHVTKTEDGWQGKKEGAKKASITGKTKEEVRQKTINIAKNKGNSSVKIHKSDGTFQEERTYPRSSDPSRTKGQHIKI